MAPKARVEFERAVYHVLDRGDRREVIFKDDEDRRRFLETLGEACARTGWRVHACVLMGNHYHQTRSLSWIVATGGWRSYLIGSKLKVWERKSWLPTPLRRPSF